MRNIKSSLKDRGIVQKMVKSRQCPQSVLKGGLVKLSNSGAESEKAVVQSLVPDCSRCFQNGSYGTDFDDGGKRKQSPEVFT